MSASPRQKCVSGKSCRRAAKYPHDLSLPHVAGRRRRASPRQKKVCKLSSPDPPLPRRRRRDACLTMGDCRRDKIVKPL
ncbi:hypothetical protein Y032_0455g1772 [Ancylostoma ceylanicum]|uniref:Uncharacterized protein n=1 Tax=Ancylostoma ceylanicum TaxID=53326 RepID=A0A016WYJ1_9BILA|nr:hypothetical protein Y032_0455g1772 [Ancylostoma ceylanicum]